MLAASASERGAVRVASDGLLPAKLDIVGGNTGLFLALQNGTQECATLLGNSSLDGEGSIHFGQNAGGMVSGSGTFTAVPEAASTLLLAGSLTLLAARHRRLAA